MSSKVDNNVVDNENENNGINDNKEESVSLSDSELEKYLSYVPVSYYSVNNILVDGAYAKEYLDISNIDKNVLVSKVIVNNEDYNFDNNAEISGRVMFDGFDERTMTKNYYSLDYINSKLKLMYNYELEGLENAISVDDAFNIKAMSYYYEDGNYIMCGGGSYGNEIILNSLENYEVANDELYIYEYAGKLNIFETSFLSDYYTKKEIDVTTFCSDAENIDKCAADYFKEHKEKFSQYKHTFKKNDAGYYWYSTEVVFV